MFEFSKQKSKIQFNHIMCMAFNIKYILSEIKEKERKKQNKTSHLLEMQFLLERDKSFQFLSIVNNTKFRNSEMLYSSV